MYLVQFKPEEIDKVWPLVKDKVQSALERNHEGKTLMDNMKKINIKEQNDINNVEIEKVKSFNFNY